MKNYTGTHVRVSKNLGLKESIDISQLLDK